MDYYYELFNQRNMNNGFRKVSCRVFNLNETQIEVFDLLITPNGEYQAWTYDTISESAINRRKEIESELNNNNKKVTA